MDNGDVSVGWGGCSIRPREPLGACCVATLSAGLLDFSWFCGEFDVCDTPKYISVCCTFNSFHYLCVFVRLEGVKAVQVLFCTAVRFNFIYLDTFPSLFALTNTTTAVPHFLCSSWNTQNVYSDVLLLSCMNDFTCCMKVNQRLLKAVDCRDEPNHSSVFSLDISHLGRLCPFYRSVFRTWLDVLLKSLCFVLLSQNKG